MPSREVDVVLLDLDGTLTDSAPGILNCLRYALDHLGIESPDDATIRTFLGPPLQVTFREHFGMDDALADAALAKYRERFHDVGLFENDVYPGIHDMIESLHETGVTLALATSKPTVSATRIVDHFDLAKRLAFVGGADLDGMRGSKAAVIEHTRAELAALGIDLDPARTLMVGDRKHDVHGAAAHDIPTVGVLWGYGSADELTTAGAIGLATAPADILTFVQPGADH